MARVEKQSQAKKQQVDSHQRQVRRNQIVLLVLSGFLIISMLLSMLINLR